jgi:16S rRNA (adenine1518-N6/adenine1519-N6)-dimethyltransferase
MEHKALKRFGQNFLKNENICKSIASFLNVDKNSNVLEIGPGQGALTKYLEPVYANFTVVEIDNDLASSIHARWPNLKIINSNIMKTDLSLYDGIIGNIPYNITTELLVKIVKDASRCKEIVFMIQKEAFERIVVASKREEVTPLSIILRIFYDYHLMLNVSKDNFEPKPNVDSIVFTLRRKDVYSEVDVKKLYYFLLILFSSRRKNIQNNLLAKYSKENVNKVLTELNIDKNTRSETLSDNEFISLYLKFIKDYNL